MRNPLWLVCILCLIQDVLSQITLVESGPGTVKSAETLQMTCKVTGVSLTDSTNMHCVAWVRQAEGKGLEYLGKICYSGGTDYSSSLQGRLTLSRDTGKGEVYFKLSVMKSEESGQYYCARQVGWPYFDIWGQGTTVTVTSVNSITPVVFPLSPYGQEGSSYITVGCLIQKSFPKPDSVEWITNTGEKLSDINNYPTNLYGEPPAYSLVSEVSVSSSEWNSKEYRCVIKHFNSSIQEMVPKNPAGCDLPESPAVYLLQGTCPSKNDDQIELSCQAYNLSSSAADMKWFINEKESSLPQDLIQMGKLKNSFYGLQSTVRISKALWNNGARVKCLVTDKKTQKSAEDTTRKCSDDINCLGVKVVMVPPTIKDLYIDNTAPIQCIVYDLKTPTGCTINWDYPGASNSLNYQNEDPLLNKNGTYTITSILTVSTDTWGKYTEFTCTVTVPGLSNPIITTISKTEETRLSEPQVAVFPPPPQEIAKKEILTLSCVVYHYYSQHIYVGWTENDVAVPKDQYINSEPVVLSEGGNQYFYMSSILQIPAKKWDDGTSYSCVVGHESIPLKFIRKSIDNNSGKPTKVNVTINMSDSSLSCY